MKKGQDKFNFFVPAVIEKAGETGELRIKGIASSSAEDSDGEFLDPSGFDFQPLLESGYFNWNHQAQKDPGAILGRPTAASITPSNQFYVEGKLYKGLREAQKLYDLACVLEEEDPDRRLGFSIEGQAIQRDPINPKRVLKARITGIAITHCPKNPNTLLSIMKGEYSEPFIDPEEISKEELNKSALDINELCQQYLGVEANKTVPVTFNTVISFLQSMFPEHINNDELIKNMCENLNKSMSTANVPMPESVDGKPKSMVEDDKVSSPVLTKSEVYQYIFDNLTQDPTLAKSIEETIQRTRQIMNKNGITLEVIEKAQEILELAKSQTPTLEKSSTSTEVSREDIDGGKIEEMVKNMLTEGLTLHQIEDSLKDDGHNISAHQELISKLCTEYNAGKDGGEVQIQKSEDNTPLEFKQSLDLLKGEIESLSQSIERDNTSLLEVVRSQNELLKSQTDMLSESIQKIESFNSLFESASTEISSLQKSKTELEERLKKVEETPLPQRSVTTTTAYKERFPEQNNENLAKAENTFDIAKSEDRSALADVLFARFETLRTQGRKNDVLEKAISDLEITHSLPASVLPMIQEMGFSVIKSK